MLISNGRSMWPGHLLLSRNEIYSDCDIIHYFSLSIFQRLPLKAGLVKLFMCKVSCRLSRTEKDTVPEVPARCLSKMQNTGGIEGGGEERLL